MAATGLKTTTCENRSANFGAFVRSATTTFLSCIVKIYVRLRSCRSYLLRRPCSTVNEKGLFNMDFRSSKQLFGNMKGEEEIRRRYCHQNLSLLFTLSVYRLDGYPLVSRRKAYSSQKTFYEVVYWPRFSYLSRTSCH